MEFTVTLNAVDDCATETVHWTTVDGTATAGEDYAGATGTLTFGPGETSKTVRVAVLNDAEDDSGETFTLRLSNASGATIADGEATGTIADEEPTVESTLRIDGVPQVGNTLRVLVDERRARNRRAARAEPPSGALTYQWLRGSEVIAGATASTYVLTVADVGARLSVRVESGDGSVTNAETPPVWSAPANPSLADGEEELLSATVTLGSHQFPFSVAGYGRVLGESFGEMDVVSFEDGGATYAIDAFLVNSRGLFGLATGSTLPDASGLVAYWNGYRISGLETSTVKRGNLPMLVGRTPQPSTEYSRYEDGASDGVQVAVSLRRVSAEAQNALTAENVLFEDLPEAHDGESAFRFRVAFSEDIGISFRSLREDAFTVTGGRVTRGKRVDDRRDLFEMTVEPDGEGDVTVTLPAGRECTVSGAICTKGENRRQLTNTPTATVAGPAVETGPAPLTASFEGVPAEHDGESAFKLRIAFSETIRMSGRRLRDEVVAVAGGRATKGRRVNKRKDLWTLTVEPDSLADVTVTLAAGAACDSPEAVCTKDGRALTNTISTTVRGPVALSVSDARAEEGTDETIDFAVTLSRAASGTVEVAYATADGTATAGEDYTRSGGTLSFAPGETEKTVSVPVLDDAIDEGEETFTLRLSGASGAVIADGEAIGTIENSDPLQKMWLSRFGRTVADHVVDAVAGRLSAPLAGAQVTLAGQSVDLSRTGDSAVLVDAMTGLARAFGAPAGPAPTDRTALDAGPDRQGGAWDSPAAGGSSPARSVTGRDLLLGSSFHLALDGEGDGGGPGLTAWGRVTVGGFDGQGEAETGAMRMDGEVITGILGADAQRGRWLAGLAFSVSEGEGTFEQPEAGNRGTVESNLTSVNPYLRFEASERLSTWGLLGFGTGEMTMTEAARGERGETVSRTDIEMRLAAVGARGALLDAGTSGGFDLAVKADAFLVETEWEKVSNETDTQAGASRVRLVLEGSRAFELGGSAKLTPGLELGLRHDGGDAETGTGVEVGGSVGYADAASGLSVEARARTLIAHEASGFEEWGASASVRLDHGAEGRGLSFSLAPTLGASSSGVDRLWSLQDARGLAPEGEFEAARSLEAHVGYGLGAFGDRGLAKPYAGLSLGEGGARTWRGGVRWTLGRSLDLGFEGRRNEAANDNDPEHGIGFRLKTRW